MSLPEEAKKILQTNVQNGIIRILVNNNESLQWINVLSVDEINRMFPDNEENFQNDTINDGQIINGK